MATIDSIRKLFREGITAAQDMPNQFQEGRFLPAPLEEQEPVRIQRQSKSLGNQVFDQMVSPPTVEAGAPPAPDTTMLGTPPTPEPTPTPMPPQLDPTPKPFDQIERQPMSLNLEQEAMAGTKPQPRGGDAVVADRNPVTEEAPVPLVPTADGLLRMDRPDINDRVEKVTKRPFKINPRAQEVLSEVPDLSPEEVALIQLESSFNTGTSPQTSNAFGLGQLIPSNREKFAKKVGVDPNTTEPKDQIKLMREYIKERYGTPEKALEFWLTPHWVESRQQYENFY